VKFPLIVHMHVVDLRNGINPRLGVPSLYVDDEQIRCEYVFTR